MDWIDKVVKDVAELDYNNPEGLPDLMLVKADELRAIIEARAPRPAYQPRLTPVGCGDGNTYVVG